MRLLPLCLLLPSLAGAQALLTYPGQLPGGAVSSGGAAGGDTLPRSFAVYGDSIALGLCNTTVPYLALSALLPGYLAASQAQSGTTTAQIAAHYASTRDTACGGERCGTYLFEGGVNDFKLGVGDPAAVLAAMLEAVDDARALGRRVVWTNVAPFRACGFCTDTATGWTLSKQYNVLWAAACATRPDVTCVDVGSGSTWEEPSTDGYLKTAWSCDGIHWLQGATDAWALLAREAFPD